MLLKRFFTSLLAFVILFTFSLSSCVQPDKDKYEIQLHVSSYQLIDGEQKALEYSITHNGEPTSSVATEFSSSDTAVVTVDNAGVMTGVSAGSATINISFMNMRATAQVSVTMRPRTVSIVEEDLVLLKGDEKQLTAKYFIEGVLVEGDELKWESSNPSVVSVENGFITAKENGAATITASCADAKVKDTIQVSVVSKMSESVINSFDEQAINIYGRSYIQSGNLCLDHVASAVEVGVIGGRLLVELTSSQKSVMKVFINDDTEGTKIDIKAGTSRYLIAQNLENVYHKIRIVKATELQDATWQIHSFSATQFASVVEKSALKVEFIGDSITAGYGVLGQPNMPKTVENSDGTSAYAYLTAQALGANYSIVAWSGICTKAYYWCKDIHMHDLYQYVSYKNKTEYTETEHPDVIVVNLGTNDAGYLSGEYGGAAYGEQFPTDYKGFLQMLRMKHPNAYIICLYGMLGKNGVIDSGIQTAIEKMNDAKIVYNPFTFSADASGAAGHPSATAQKDWATALTKYISSL